MCGDAGGKLLSLEALSDKGYNRCCDGECGGVPRIGMDEDTDRDAGVFIGVAGGKRWTREEDAGISIAEEEVDPDEVR